MADTTTPSSQTPWHLWVVGVVSLLWNAMGAVDFTMTQLNSETWLEGYTPEQLAYIHGFPLWAMLAWGIATWSSLLGSLLLLLRRALAFHFFAVSTVVMPLTSLYSFVLSDGMKVMGGGVGMYIFNAVIFVVCVLLLIYARKMRKRAVLH